ncbi:MAG: PQQ-dependent sugar dehydrogenase [Rubrivivax sp.]|nr:PQQ-dependent sugar dehydrogenase [Rubrivivax sp.]
MDMERTTTILAVAVLAACGGGGGADEAIAATPPAAAAGPLRATPLASGLVNPWSLAFLPDGRMLVTERPGRLRLVSADGRTVSPAIAGVPAVDARGQGGLFDVAPAADFASTRRVFLSYAEAGSGAEAGRNGLAVGTALLNASATALTGWQVIYRQAPKVASAGHFGGRIVVAPGGLLYVTLGDRQLNSERGKAQDLSQGHGKIVRIRSDGSVPPDNPFVGRSGAQPTTWSYGHRNVQGAALHPSTGELWATEHGPQGGDELNRVHRGANYGWPLVSHGCEYGSPVGTCAPVGGASTGAGFELPVSFWVPTSIAPSGLVFYTGSRFPEWRGQLFMGALAGQALWRIEFSGNTVVAREALLRELRERIRDVRQGPDGWLYLLTDSGNGQLLRVER